MIGLVPTIRAVSPTFGFSQSWLGAFVALGEFLCSFTLDVFPILFCPSRSQNAARETTPAAPQPIDCNSNLTKSTTVLEAQKMHRNEHLSIVILINTII